MWAYNLKSRSDALPKSVPVLTLFGRACPKCLCSPKLYRKHLASQAGISFLWEAKLNPALLAPRGGSWLAVSIARLMLTLTALIVIVLLCPQQQGEAWLLILVLCYLMVKALVCF